MKDTQDPWTVALIEAADDWLAMSSPPPEDAEVLTSFADRLSLAVAAVRVRSGRPFRRIARWLRRVVAGSCLRRCVLP